MNNNFRFLFASWDCGLPEVTRIDELRKFFEVRQHEKNESPTMRWLDTRKGIAGKMGFDR